MEDQPAPAKEPKQEQEQVDAESLKQQSEQEKTESLKQQSGQQSAVQQQSRKRFRSSESNSEDSTASSIKRMRVSILNRGEGEIIIV